MLGAELGPGEPMTHSTDLIPVLRKLTLPTFVEAEGVYCEQERAVGHMLNYGEEDRMLGEILREHPRGWVIKATLPGRIDLSAEA